MGIGQHKLRSRTQLYIAALLTIFFIVAIATSWFTLRGSFDQFEKSSISQELSRLELWLNEELESLYRSANDYAFWDDSYLFMQNKNSAYTDENVSIEVFDNLDIDLFAFVTTDGKLFYARQRSESGDGEPELVPPDEKLALWLRTRPVLKTVQQRIDAIGVVNHFGDTPILIGAAPILRSDSSGPSNGTLLMLRILDTRRIAQDAPLGGKEWKISEAAADTPVALGITHQENQLHITREMAGINDAGATLISLSSETQLENQFATAMRVNSINLALMVVATLLLLGFVLNRLVLNRVLFFNQRADDIRISGDLALRIPHDDYDELDQLAQTVNEMLDELQHTNRQLYHDSLHDSLTGLGNRVLLNERLEYTLKLSHIEGEPFAIMIIDLDGFKDINDLHGHAAGDAILAQSAIQIINWCGPADTAVRLGGDEFAIIRLITPGGSDTLTEEVNELRAALSCKHLWEEIVLKVSASIGIAISDPERRDETPSDLLRNADTALYRAKEEGRDRVSFYTPDMRQVLFERMTLMQELEDAIANDKLLLHFQPILDREGKPYSVEALIRWPHPERGMVPPDHFIPIAEKSLLITELDLWVIKSTCEALKRLRQHAPTLMVTINCSARTLLEKDVTAILLREMERHHLPSSTVNVELTETALARSEAEMVPILERMAINDVRIYIDDFGTGYSSLNRLHLLPFHHLKVDRSFIRNIDKGDQTITRTIIQMAKSLDKKVVIEGVETESQRQVLEQLGADYMQGYLFCRPLPEEELIKWLKLVG